MSDELLGLVSAGGSTEQAEAEISKFSANSDIQILMVPYTALRGQTVFPLESLAP